MVVLACFLAGWLLSASELLDMADRELAVRCTATVDQEGPAEWPSRPSCCYPEAADPHHGAGSLVFNLSFKS